MFEIFVLRLVAAHLCLKASLEAAHETKQADIVKLPGEAQAYRLVSMAGQKPH